MRLLPREIDKLVLTTAGELAQKRLARGVRLNATEATALISHVILELARDGDSSVTMLATRGATLLGTRYVQDCVPFVLKEVQIEAGFRDGTKLVTVHNPIATTDGDLEACLYGSFLPVPPNSLFPIPTATPVVPGEVFNADSPIVLNSSRTLLSLRVTNNGDRPVQVGSHYHFVETNPLLCFDRAAAYGFRLNIPAGTAVRFEPGESKTVSLCALGGSKVATGGNGLASGPITESKRDAVLAAAIQRGFQHEPTAANSTLPPPLPYRMDRVRYAAAYGPTTGDMIRLGDTSLLIEIERDFTQYGDECVFGGGKTIREGMAQANAVRDSDALDLVITNAVILDHTGIYKADIGIKHGIIVGIGKAGNPQIMDGVSSSMVIGVTTEVLSAEGKIITAGAIDTHVHFICPQLCTEAIASGITTMIGGGTGPNTGTNATTCTSGKHHIKMMLQSTDGIPLNFGFTGKGNSSSKIGLDDQVLAGAIGLKLHEDWGSSPAAIDTCLQICDEYDVQVTKNAPFLVNID